MFIPKEFRALYEEYLGSIQKGNVANLGLEHRSALICNNAEKKKNPAQKRRWRTLVTAKGKGGQEAATCTGTQPIKHDTE